MEPCSFVDGNWKEKRGKESPTTVLQFFTKTFCKYNSIWRIQFINWRCQWLGLWKWRHNRVSGIRGTIGGGAEMSGNLTFGGRLACGRMVGRRMPERSYILSRTINYLERHEFTFGTTTVSDRKRDPFSWPYSRWKIKRYSSFVVFHTQNNRTLYHRTRLVPKHTSAHTCMYIIRTTNIPGIIGFF